MRRGAILVALAGSALAGCGALLGIGDLDVRANADAGPEAATNDAPIADVPITPDGAIDAAPDGSPLPAALVCSRDGWCWTNPLPAGNRWYGVWGTSADDVWVVGEAATVLHYASGTWTRQKLTVTDEMHAIWGSAAEDIWIGGDEILHLKSGQLTVVPSPGDRLFELGGTSASDVWAVGPSGSVIHYDGTSWKRLQSGVTVNYFGLGVNAPNDAWFAGQKNVTGATVSHYFAGDAGLAFYTTLVDGTQGDMNDVVPVSAQEAWGVGNYGTVMHYTLAAGWSITQALGPNLERVVARAPNDIWAVGGQSLHYDGANWSVRDLGGGYYNGLYVAPTGEAWAAGKNGFVRKWANGAWNKMEQGPTATINAVTGVSANDVWAVGDAGTVMHWTGASWKVLPGATAERLLGAWAVGGELWTAGTNGTILHYAGGTPALAAGIPAVKVTAIWGSSASDIWAVGDHGTILHYDGTTWTSATSPVTTLLTAVHGLSAQEAWAVGIGGVILHMSGGTWTVEASNTSTDLAGVFAIGSDVWAVGPGGTPGTTLRRTGGAWASAAGPNSPISIRGTSASDLWAVGWNGGIAHFDGSKWSQKLSGTTQTTFLGVWSASANDVWAVGEGGAILHHAP